MSHCGILTHTVTGQQQAVECSATKKTPSDGVKCVTRVCDSCYLCYCMQSPELQWNIVKIALNYRLMTSNFSFFENINEY